MPRTTLPIANGFYESDSLPISSQNCVNLYPVIEDVEALAQETLCGAPGVEWILANAITGEVHGGGGVDGGGGGDSPDAGGTDIG
jgi:hypothetical protein